MDQWIKWFNKCGWVTVTWVTGQCRKTIHEFGHECDQLLTELHKEDRHYLRIYHLICYKRLEKLTPHIKKQTTFMREPLEVGLKLAATLRFLATGNSYHSLQYSFRVEATTIL